MICFKFFLGKQRSASIFCLCYGCVSVFCFCLASLACGLMLVNWINVFFPFFFVWLFGELFLSAFVLHYLFMSCAGLSFAILHYLVNIPSSAIPHLFIRMRLLGSNWGVLCPVSVLPIPTGKVTRYIFFWLCVAVCWWVSVPVFYVQYLAFFDCDGQFFRRNIRLLRSFWRRSRFL